jgi:DNA-binding transcriptional regulator YhcF (GntR family)
VSRPSERLRQWLDLELSARQPGDRLPTDRQLAAQWDVSERTVHRILGAYGRQGKVVRIQGRGTFLPGVEGAKPEVRPGATATSAQTIVDEVFRAMCAGEIRQGEALPAVKALCVQFRVSPPTVIRAYRELAARGHVTKVGKTFWVGRFGRLVRQAVRRRAFLFSSGAGDFAEVFRHDMMAVSYRAMERELSANGCMLLCAPSAQLAGLAEQWLRRRDLPDGVAFHGVTAKHFDAAIAPAVRRLKRPAGAGPAVLIDNLPDFSRDFRGMCVLTRGAISTATARAAAQTIVSAGCRRVLVVMEPEMPYDPAHGRLWTFWQLVKLRTELTGLAPDVSFGLALVGDRRGPGAVEAFVKGLARLAPGHERSLLAKYRSTTFEQVTREIAAVQRLSDALTDRPQADIWVFAAHARAAEALALAQARGLNVPRDVAVLSLENDPSYYHLGITCCEPDWESIGYVMAHALLKDIPVEKTRRGFLRVGARVVQRLTTK